jgi:hypothetical protein
MNNNSANSCKIKLKSFSKAQIRNVYYSNVDFKEMFALRYW